MATKTTSKKQTVYVLVCEWRDRHGEEDVNDPQAFSSLSSAQQAMSDDVICYLDEHDGFTDDDKLDIDSIYCVNDDMDDRLTSRKAIAKDAKKRTCYDVNVDDEGTWARWNITKVTVND